MAKYKLKSLSVQINGKVYRKSENIVFDTEKEHSHIKNEIESALKAGFLEVIIEEKPVKKVEPVKEVKEKKDKEVF